MSKRKAPKFNAVLEDFRKFIGETKEAEEPQGDSESAAPKATSDKEVTEVLPGGGKAQGSTTDPASTRGVATGETLPGAKQPSTEEEERKEVPASSKVAQEEVSLVNRLLANIKIAADALAKESESPVTEKTNVPEEKAESKEEKVAEECKEEEEADEPDTAQTKAEEVAEEAEDAKEEAEEQKTEEKEASVEIDEDALAEKIASHYRNISVGYELGKFLFQTLGNKVAEDMVDPAVTNAAAEAGIPAGVPTEAPAEGGGDAGNSDIEAILAALQELVQEGSITEEQAQQVLMELQAAVEGGATPESGAPVAPEEKAAGEIFTPEQKLQIEAAINAKVAEWVSEGKTDSEIAELVKQAAESDSAILVEQAKVAAQEEEGFRKLAALKELGATDEQIAAYFDEVAAQTKAAKEAAEVESQIEKMVMAKVAELEGAGYTPEQIEEYLKQAAQEDAKLVKQAEVQNAIRAKVAADRQKKIASVPPEVQQILQALESLLQSGEISEEEAMQVLQELGLTGDAAANAPSEGAAPEGAPVEAPAEEAAPEGSESHEKEESPEEEAKEEEKEEK